MSEKKKSEMNKKVRMLSKQLEMGEINGFEFDREFRKLSDKYLGTKLTK